MKNIENSDEEDQRQHDTEHREPGKAKGFPGGVGEFNPTSRVLLLPANSAEDVSNLGHEI